MKNTVLVIAVAIVALFSGALYFAVFKTVEEPVFVPAAAPIDDVTTGSVQVSFQLEDLDGEIRDFSEWNGKHRILNFWATWCAPCRREIPLLKAFQEQHGADGIQVIGIAVEYPEPVIAYARAAEFNYPILVGEQEAMAIAESSGIPFIGLPFTMIVASDGELIGARMGEIHQQHLDEIAAVLSQIDTGQIDKAAAREILSGF